MRYDNNELQILAYRPNFPATDSVAFPPKCFNPEKINECEYFQATFANPIFPGDKPPLEIAQFEFRVLNEQDWPGDGSFDFAVFNVFEVDQFSLVHAKINPDAFEIQGPNPVPVPVTTPLLGAGVFFDYARKLRRRVRQVRISTSKE